VSQPSPAQYYEVLHELLLELFGHDWHLGYWVNASTPADAARRLNEVMANRLAATAGMTVLDIGCGVGGPACDIAETTGARVVGVSNSRVGLAEAERYARQRGVENLLRFEFAAAPELPFPDGTFDAVWSSEAIHNLEDPAPLAREMARVLKPGGRAVLGDLFFLGDTRARGIDSSKYKQFSFHLMTADDWIAGITWAPGVRSYPRRSAATGPRVPSRGRSNA
jgi:ubiquinone/menaquinone biosynthesis C-methylase UbiE